MTDLKECKLIDTKEVIQTPCGKFLISFEGYSIINYCLKYQIKIKICDISKYCTNFKTFLQLQLFKHSLLSRAVVKRFN
jgi:hypothetical protein